MRRNEWVPYSWGCHRSGGSSVSRSVRIAASTDEVTHAAGSGRGTCRSPSPPCRSRRPRQSLQETEEDTLAGTPKRSDPQQAGSLDYARVPVALDLASAARPRSGTRASHQSPSANRIARLYDHKIDQELPAQRSSAILQDWLEGRHPERACGETVAPTRGAEPGQWVIGHESAGLGAAPAEG